ncbi:hypothetical protein VTI74DRAFT_2140 [Chaetomium olivicolor]
MRGALGGAETHCGPITPSNDCWPAIFTGGRGQQMDCQRITAAELAHFFGQLVRGAGRVCFRIRRPSRRFPTREAGHSDNSSAITLLSCAVAGLDSASSANCCFTGNRAVTEVDVVGRFGTKQLWPTTRHSASQPCDPCCGRPRVQRAASVRRDSDSPLVPPQRRVVLGSDRGSNPR